MVVEIKDIEIKYNETIKNYTFTKIGGVVDILAFPKRLSDIENLLNHCKSEKIPWMALGNASNVIISDSGFRGMIIMLTKMNTIEIKENLVIAGAGANLYNVTKAAYQRGLTGLEFACGIPGSIGGAVYMNAGAYGGEICDVLTSVTYLKEDGECITLTKDELACRYRYSKLQDMRGVVIAATFCLKKGNKHEIKETMRHLTTLREMKQPLEYPSCGSVFKRPQGHYTGQLIQESGLQGKQVGGAQISTKHAGFIVNVGNASANDYIALISHIQKTIYKRNQIHLEPEVRIIGDR